MGPRLDGQAITRVAFDHAIVLFTEAGVEITIEQAFVLAGPDGQATTVDPDDVGSHATLVLGCLHGVIASGDIEASGMLALRLADGSTLVVPPHPEFEAWTISGQRQEHVVCLPGGGVAEWPPLGGP